MPPHIYSLEDRISEFFQTQSSVSRQQCDDMALSISGSPISPAPIQGAFSYTVIAGALQSKIVQFRTQSSLLDMETLIAARDVHPDFVPATAFHGILGEGQASPLSIYVMDRISGTTYIEARFYDKSTAEARLAGESRRMTTVTDFARFFSQAWKGRQSLSMEKVDALRLQHGADLELLSQSLPQRFSIVLQQLRTHLPLLYTPPFPLVLTHDDLCEMNILMDPETGKITGFIDWAEAKILPFGFALWGFLNVIGWMDSKGWHYYSNRQDLEDQFWKTFDESIGGVTKEVRDTIRVSSIVGFFLRYGFAWDEGVRRRPVTELDYSIKYLDAFFSSEKSVGNSFILSGH
ncbi:uncharacterized protein BDZ99DRAFT_425575 [Mytilinidion resinicola]|uniref:Aminoglycoside phosphotransferase domain-containing protein n=1 Tax=Mytilinidion resinicola TaxID=574789 RepID=A0A6A6Y9A9_9PEZI|nr:uncharacterized protein BDZ99DRAFT_425575 [Mytilinidion resinicola]KAF2804705.1 hypothetical protein BDZ99DRAFT_425575 [Mytilinidion resinicola]